MRSLNRAQNPLPKQWLQAVLLHGVLLSGVVWYHLHSHDPLNFSAKSFYKLSTDAMVSLTDNNLDFLELSFEQYDVSAVRETNAKLAEAPIEVAQKVPIAPLNEVVLEASAHAKKTTTTDVAATKATEQVVFRGGTEKQEVKPKSLLQRHAPARAARASTQPASRPSPSTSPVTAQPPQTARPDHAHSPKPAYPLALRDLGVSGIVWLRVWVDSTGRPREIELAKGSGYRLFDEAALRAVHHWRFIPAKNEQQSVASWVEFAVRFEING